MRIMTSTSVIAEPAFPNYVYTGKLELSQIHIDSILDEINSLRLYQYNWGKSGWNNDINEPFNFNHVPNIKRVTPLIIIALHGGLVNQNGWAADDRFFETNSGRYYLDCRRTYPVILYPHHDMPLNKAAYYSGITILKCSEKSHRPYIQCTDHGVLHVDPIKCWYPEVNQQIFVPGNLHWGISSGNDDTPTVALISHIFRNKVH